MTQDVQIARERMKRRLNATRARTGYTFREPSKVLTSPSGRTSRHERIDSSIRRDKFIP